MSYGAWDFADDVNRHLTAAGYAVTQGTDGEPAEDGGYWFTVNGKRPDDSEPSDTELGAWVGALCHSLQRAKHLRAALREIELTAPSHIGHIASTALLREVAQ